MGVQEVGMGPRQQVPFCHPIAGSRVLQCILLTNICGSSTSSRSAFFSSPAKDRAKTQGQGVHKACRGGGGVF